jgi:hypothetical protein
MQLLHLYHDNLWQSGDTSISMPVIISKQEEKVTDVANKLEETHAKVNQLDKQNNDEEFETKMNDLAEEICDTKLGVSESIEQDSGKAVMDDAQLDVDDTFTPKEETESIDHEALLCESFLCAVKFKSKEIKLPIIASTFMKLMQQCWYT